MKRPFKPLHKITVNKPVRPLYQIASDIRCDWGRNMYFGAVPYFKAMEGMDKITDMYGCESAKDIVLYFLSNASGWKGKKAKEIKAELRAMCK